MAKQNKRTFLFSIEWYEVLLEYPEEVRFEVYEAIMRYASTGTTGELKPLSRMAFSFIKKEMDEQFEKSNCGEQHWNWKGGISSKNHSIRNSSEYRQWRKAVFERDNYTCVNCGKHGGRLNAHHRVAFSICPEKRLEVSNGITLCYKCHNELHKHERPWLKTVF